MKPHGFHRRCGGERCAECIDGINRVRRAVFSHLVQVLGWALDEELLGLGEVGEVYCCFAAEHSHLMIIGVH